MKLGNPLAMVIKDNNGSFRKCFGEIKKLSCSLLVLQATENKRQEGEGIKNIHISD